MFPATVKTGGFVINAGKSLLHHGEMAKLVRLFAGFALGILRVVGVRLYNNFVVC
jgi:hypothetical protein